MSQHWSLFLVCQEVRFVKNWCDFFFWGGEHFNNVTLISFGRYEFETLTVPSLMMYTTNVVIVAHVLSTNF